MKEFPWLRPVRIILPLLVGLYWSAGPAAAQDSGDQGTLRGGDRAEIAVTVRDSSGEVIVAPANVRLYKNGVPSDQSLTSHGRAFFIARTLGDFTILVEAAGYKTAQKDLSLTVPNRAEVDVYLERDSASNVSVGVPGKPVLAPKAKEALVKGLQALGADKLDEAQKHLSEAMKLAPGNPEVLYVQGMVYMKRREWAQAQPVLEKSNQIDPNQPRVLAALGMSLSNQKKYEEAKKVLLKAVEDKANRHIEIYDHLGDVYMALNEKDKAVKAWQKGIGYMTATKRDKERKAIVEKKIKENK